MLLGDITRRNAQLYPSRMAVIEGDNRLNHLELDQRTNRVANAIINLGLDKEDRVAVLNHNCFQFIELYFGVAKAGMTIVPLNFRMEARELAYTLNDSESKVLIFGKTYAPLVEAIKDQVPSVKYFICFEPVQNGFLDYSDVIEASSDIDPYVPMDEYDMVILCYTGGTTGKPKGVMVTHRGLITNCHSYGLTIHFHPGVVYLNVAPVFHAGDCSGMLSTIFAGGCNVFTNSSEPEDILETIEKYRITYTILVPSVILRMIQYEGLEKYDISSWEYLMYGTAPMPLEPLKQALKTLKLSLIHI